jgi:uncharacterized membrane protein
MEWLYNPWIYLVIFLVSGGLILYHNENKKDKIEAQFVVATGCIVVAFYIVCFLSGICTILNFLWRWIL